VTEPPAPGGVAGSLVDPVQTEHDRTPSTSTGERAWRVTVVAVTITLITGCVAAALAAVFPARVLIAGLPEAPRSVQLMLPAVKGIFDLMAALTIGWLLAAAALAAPQPSGVFDVGGYRAVRAASLAGWVWAASAFALIPLTLADTLGRPLSESFDSDALLSALSVLDNMRAALIALAVALVIALLARTILRPGWAFLLLGLALFALIPFAASGHSADSGDHDLAVDTMIYHLVGVTLWVGGLLAFLGLARQRIARLDVAARRYSTMAGIAFGVVAISGVMNAWIRLPYLGDLWTTDYGFLILLKAVLLICLGCFGLLHRRRTLPAISTRNDPRALIRLAAVELGVMAATIGVAAALARTATPPPRPEAVSDIASVLGFDLPGSPTFATLMTAWRFDVIYGTATLVAAGLYLWGVRRLHRRGDRWPVGRTVAWLLGCFSVLMATSSGIGRYAVAQFSIHMISHMLLGMLAPIMLALGGPITLLLRVLKPAGPQGVPGVREAVVGVLHSRFVRFITQPLVVLALFVGSFYALYFTSLFDVMIDSHLGHLVMIGHFLVVGYLYYWVIIGVDPGPRRLSYPTKLALLLAAMPFHAFFGLALMNSHELLGASYFQSLSLPWVTDLLADQRLGGAIAWGATEVPLLVVLIALMAQWARSDDREARRTDRRLDAGGDDGEVAAYNAMLAKLAENDQHQARAPRSR
jgi:cytochrome c oxidase assembly factor CtaG/putative copper export protein